MPADARRRAACAGAALLAGLLASCTQALAPPAEQAARLPAAPAGVCRIGPDGGPPPGAATQTVDRGIGGTGAPLQVADRGIGGTGAPAQQADRGIGGTGIIAVITGFASVCLGGQEVAFDPDVPVRVGERPAAPDALRAGQVALIDAGGASGALRARSIAVRYEVSGQVEQADAAGLRVAGQSVALSADTLGDRPAPGEWVAVSGLRRPDGVIAATRLDRRSAGDVVVHGRLVRVGPDWRIGLLPVRLAPNAPVLEGQEVLALGTMDGGTLRAEQISPDLLASNPSALFGAGIGGLVIEGYAVVEGSGRVRFGQGFSAAAPGVRPADGSRSVLTLQRDGGGLRAIDARASGPAGLGPRGDTAPAPARRFEAAPVPNRALGPPRGAGRGEAGRAAGLGGGQRRMEQDGADRPGDRQGSQGGRRGR